MKDDMVAPPAETNDRPMTHAADEPGKPPPKAPGLPKKEIGVPMPKVTPRVGRCPCCGQMKNTKA